MNPETLKEYLVKIGWDVDELGLSKLTSTLGNIKSLIKKFFGDSGENIASGLTSVLGTIKDVNSAAIGLIETTAGLDYETEKLARRYWISEKAARSYQTALDALGETQEDVFYMTDEQYKRLIELNNLGKSLEAPAEVDNFLLKIRDINFEFSKLKVEIQYGTRYAMYYSSKYLGVDIDNLLQKLRNFNTFIQRNLPAISKKVAEFFEIFYRLAKAGVQIGKVLYSVINAIFEIFDNKLGRTMTLATVFFRLLKSGPIGWAIAALTTLLLLIDDYMTWQRGGDSYFDWSGFDEIFGDTESSLSDIKSSLSDIFDSVSDIFNKLGLKQTVLNTFKITAEGIDVAFKGTASSLSLINKMIDGFKENGFEGLKDALSAPENFVSEPVLDSAVSDVNSRLHSVSNWFSRLFSFITGSNSDENTASQFGSSATNSSQTNNYYTNYGGFNVGSSDDLNDTLDMLDRRNQYTPTK